jgi:mannose-6-phosphate isomerase-like protein (cupin superfamily)
VFLIWKKKTIKNNDYRHVLKTLTNHEQLVLMSLLPGQEIGMEVHPNVDQFIRVEKGIGKASTPTRSYNIKDGSAIMVPAGTFHNIENTGKHTLKLYTIYAPPNHPPGTIQHSKPLND